MKETRTCNFPGCDKSEVARGLCDTHYSRLKSTTVKIRKEAEKYANPTKYPNRGNKKAAIAGEDERPRQTTSGGSGLGDRLNARQKERSEENNRLIATLTAFATMMGIKRTGETHQGLLYVSPINEKTLLLSHEGNLHSVDMNVGEAMEI